MSKWDGKQDEWTSVDCAVDFFYPGGAWDSDIDRDKLSDPEWLATAAQEYLDEWVRPAIDAEVEAINDPVDGFIRLDGEEPLVARYPSYEQCLEDIREAARRLLEEHKGEDDVAGNLTQRLAEIGEAPRTVNLSLVGVNGNAFSIMGAFKRRARAEGWTDEEIKVVCDEAMDGDYDHLLATIARHCEPTDDEDEG